MFTYLSSESENSSVYVSVYLWDVSLCFNVMHTIQKYTYVCVLKLNNEHPWPVTQTQELELPVVCVFLFPFCSSPHIRGNQ